MKTNHCVFIISHGRPDNVKTYKTLKKNGLESPVFIVCDNEDKSVDEYRKAFGGEMVLVFNKLEYARMVDSCDNFENRKTTTHARNACFDFAEKLGFELFVVLDDDYQAFDHTFGKTGDYIDRKVSKISRCFDACFRMLLSDERISAICFLQGGDLIGGESNASLYSGAYPFNKRKAMNSFFCSTKKRFWFFSRLNEDVNTYLLLGSRGRVFLSMPDIHLHQATTQSSSGGMTEAYLQSGTYVKSFYTVMICPSFAKVVFDSAVGRIHHRIKWDCAVPKILSQEHRKL